MNVVVQRARHPELRDYIHSAASGLLPFIQKVSVCRPCSLCNENTSSLAHTYASVNV